MRRGRNAKTPASYSSFLFRSCLLVSTILSSLSRTFSSRSFFSQFSNLSETSNRSVTIASIFHSSFVELHHLQTFILGGVGMSGGNPDFSFDGDYSFSDSHPTTAAGQDARNNQHQNNDSVDMGSPGGGAGGDVASSFSSDQLPGEDDEATAARVAGAGAEGNGAGGAGGGASSGVGREGCGWPCVVCTFVNEVDQSQCAMCTTPGPPLAERQAAEVQGGGHMYCICVCVFLSLSAN